MTDVMRLRNTLQADYNEAVVSDFDADLFLALDLALGMIEELQARVGALEDAAKSTPKQPRLSHDTQKTVLKALANELSNAKDQHYRFNHKYGAEYENTQYWAKIIASLEAAIAEVTN